MPPGALRWTPECSARFHARSGAQRPHRHTALVEHRVAVARLRRIRLVSWFVPIESSYSQMQLRPGEPGLWSLRRKMRLDRLGPRARVPAEVRLLADERSAPAPAYRAARSLVPSGPHHRDPQTTARRCPRPDC